jgi:RINT-1 / TIP-1 family
VDPPTEHQVPTAPILPLSNLAHPLVLRFRYHFDGKRQTNRLDKVRQEQTTRFVA